MPKPEAAQKGAQGETLSRQGNVSWKTQREYMLILSRRPGESLYVGDNIKVTVLSVQGKQIKIGLEVPRDMTVYREEVYKKVQEQNQTAVESSDADLLAVTSLWDRKTKK